MQKFREWLKKRIMMEAQLMPNQLGSLQQPQKLPSKQSNQQLFAPPHGVTAADLMQDQEPPQQQGQQPHLFRPPAIQQP